MTCVTNGAVADVRTYRLHFRAILMFVSDVVRSSVVFNPFAGGVKDCVFAHVGKGLKRVMNDRDMATPLGLYVAFSV